MKTPLFGLILTMFAAPALAQDAPPPPGGAPMRAAPMRGAGGGMMMRADTNGDGVISREEYLAQASQRFERLDLNHDGKLTRDELEQAGRRMAPMRGGDMPPPPPPPQN